MKKSSTLCLEVHGMFGQYNNRIFNIDFQLLFQCVRQLGGGVIHWVNNFRYKLNGIYERPKGAFWKYEMSAVVQRKQAMCACLIHSKAIQYRKYIIGGENTNIQ